MGYLDLLPTTLVFASGVLSLLKVFESIKGLGIARMSGAITGLAAVVGAVILLALAYSSGEYRPFYTGHGEGEVAAVIEKLKAIGMPYKVEGYMISVPNDMLSTASRHIESAGITQAAPAGFEIFDRSGLFLPEFTQRVNYSRALSGELARTIGQIDGVESARVHLALPEKGIFGARETSGKTASAAVIITLRPGAAFTAGQAATVAHLVAAGVPELNPDGVTVVDTAGRLLAGGYGASARSAALGEMRAMEAAIEGRLQAALDKAVGQGRAVVSVSTDIDTRRMGVTVLLSGVPDDVASLEAMLKAASGFSEKRGDTLVITAKTIALQGQSGPQVVTGNVVGQQPWVYLVYIAAAFIILSSAGLVIWTIRRRRASVDEASASPNRPFPAGGNEGGGAGRDEAAKRMERPAAPVDVVDIINRAPVKAIAEAFKAEHPQVIAAVLSQLSPERAAEMLDALPQGTRADIQARASGLTGLLPAALRDIAAVLKARGVTAVL